MKKILLLATFLIFGFTYTSHAQLQEGNFMLGADIGSGLATSTTTGLFGFNLGLNENSGYNIGISPKAGYFLSDKFIIGTIINLGFTNTPGNDDESSNTFVYGAQAFSRFYVSPAEADVENVVSTGEFYMETNAGLAGVNVENGPTTNGFAFGFGPGYSLFINETVALDASFKYNGLVGAGNTDYQHSLGINLGINVFFTRSAAKSTIQDF